MRELGKPIVVKDMSYLGCVPYRLRRHGAYDLIGRVAASFCLDSLLTFSSRRKLKEEYNEPLSSHTRWENMLNLTAMAASRLPMREY
jgi:hypothetical protein